MRTDRKSKFTRIAGNISVFLAVIAFLAAIATPDYGPAPSTRSIVLITVFASIPLLVLGVWLRRRARYLADRSEMETYAQELDEQQNDREGNCR